MIRKEHPQFRSKAQREQDIDLQAKYRELGNPELVAAIKQQKSAKQQQAEVPRSRKPRDHD
jgi:hypothetical protein